MYDWRGGLHAPAEAKKKEEKKNIERWKVVACYIEGG